MRQIYQRRSVAVSSRRRAASRAGHEPRAPRRRTPEQAFDDFAGNRPDRADVIHNPDLSAATVAIAAAGADKLGPGSAELVEVVRKHLVPCRPVVPPFVAPGIDPVRDASFTERLGHRPGLADVLPLTLAGGEQDEPLPQGVELLAVDARQECGW